MSGQGFLTWFRCLKTAATENTERSKGRITKQDNSGTAGVEVGVSEGGKDGLRIGVFVGLSVGDT